MLNVETTPIERTDGPRVGTVGKNSKNMVLKLLETTLSVGTIGNYSRSRNCWKLLQQ